MKKIVVVVFTTLLCGLIFGQSTVNGIIQHNGKPVEFVAVGIPELSISSMTDGDGKFELKNVPNGTHEIKVNHITYEDKSISIAVKNGKTPEMLSITLTEKAQNLDDFVVTGTRTERRKTESPVIVNVLNSQTLENVQACNLADGLKFQPGLRVENNCQTCNYTQLRMNGLAGGYSQILINGRPIFSPLTSLYGLEQVPVNMIDRVEIVRGGGSSLYGSSAIGGTVNVITKIPKKSAFEANMMTQSINGEAMDNVFSGNGSLVNKKKNAGVNLFLNQRNREFYDHNDDNFSELPELANTSFWSKRILFDWRKSKN